VKVCPKTIGQIIHLLHINGLGREGPSPAGALARCTSGTCGAFLEAGDRETGQAGWSAKRGIQILGDRVGGRWRQCRRPGRTKQAESKKKNVKRRLHVAGKPEFWRARSWTRETECRTGVFGGKASSGYCSAFFGRWNGKASGAGMRMVARREVNGDPVEGRWNLRMKPRRGHCNGQRKELAKGKEGRGLKDFTHHVVLGGLRLSPEGARVEDPSVKGGRKKELAAVFTHRLRSGSSGLGTNTRGFRIHGIPWLFGVKENRVFLRLSFCLAGEETQGFDRERYQLPFWSSP